MIFYTSDLHFGYENIIVPINRPFNSVNEMYSILIACWNEKVDENDDIYILGDLSYK